LLGDVGSIGRLLLVCEQPQLYVFLILCYCCYKIKYCLCVCCANNKWFFCLIQKFFISFVMQDLVFTLNLCLLSIFT